MRDTLLQKHPRIASHVFRFSRRDSGQTKNRDAGRCSGLKSNRDSEKPVNSIASKDGIRSTLLRAALCTTFDRLKYRLCIVSNRKIQFSMEINRRTEGRVQPLCNPFSIATSTSYPTRTHVPQKRVQCICTCNMLEPFSAGMVTNNRFANSRRRSPL